MNLNQLNYFVALAHIEHYTKAAEMLSITQPSLSHAIHLLEEELGTTLFRKQGRNIILTKYGRLFLEYAEESLNTLDTGIRKIRTMTGQACGNIDLGYIYTLGSSFVPKLVNTFLSEHADMDIQFHFTVSNTSALIKGLKEERFDVIFCSKKENEKDIEFLPIVGEELVVITPKNHPLSSFESVTLSDTIQYPQICFTNSSGLRPIIDSLFHAENLDPHIAYEIEEDASMAGLVAENFGIAIIPNIPILKTLDVHVLPIRNLNYERYIYMARMKNSYTTPIVELFSKYVKEHTNIHLT